MSEVEKSEIKPDYRDLIRSSDDTVSTFSWLIVHLVLFIPVLNLLALLYWSVSGRTASSKRTFARSVLLVLIAFAGSAYAFWQIEPGRDFIQGPLLDSVVGFVSESVQEFEESSPRYRVFTDTDGREIEARVQDFSGSRVIIKRRDGEVFEADFNKFSQEDRDYLIELRIKMEQQ